MRSWKTSPEAKNEFAVEGGVVWIRLTQGQETCVDLKNWGKISARKWCAHRCRKTFYAVTNVQGGEKRSTLRIHQVLSGKGADHRDLNGLNNLEANIRPANRRQNGQNRGPQLNNTSGFKGVSSAWGKWRARICVDGVERCLGTFSSPEDAARAYDKAALENFGEFAVLNFPT